ELTGSTNLITHYNLEHAYNKFCGKKVKEKLSNFLPDLPGMIDLPGSHDNSSLRSLIEKPPICGSSFTPLTGAMLTGFRLHAGPLPEQCRLMHIQPPKKKNKHKHKQSRTQDPVPPGRSVRAHAGAVGSEEGSGAGGSAPHTEISYVVPPTPETFLTPPR
ncbi:PREDICTED: mediator of RNA polymerase II transcription subunit 19, partial [Tinamus guttatus]|uniref:mediator of RNA polymerase II transcription subunit 19 n=1 Tax=Tinamus guttatus TaxID=94827 RepID=UPI00052F2221